MSSKAERHGTAGEVRGPFLALVEIEGFPTDRPIAAFLRPEERDLFMDAIQFVYAYREGRKIDARDIMNRMLEGRTYPPMRKAFG